MPEANTQGIVQHPPPPDAWSIELVRRFVKFRARLQKSAHAPLTSEPAPIFQIPDFHQPETHPKRAVAYMWAPVST